MRVFASHLEAIVRLGVGQRSRGFQHFVGLAFVAPTPLGALKRKQIFVGKIFAGIDICGADICGEIFVGRYFLIDIFRKDIFNKDLIWHTRFFQRRQLQQQ